MDRDLQIEFVRTEAALAALEPEWKALYAASRPRNPFLSWEWTAICRKYLAPTSEPYVITLRRGGSLVAAAPLRREHSCGFRVLRFIGDGRSDYLGFLLHPELPGTEAALLDALAQRRKDWDLAVLRQLSIPYSALPHTRVGRSLRHVGVEGTTAPYLAFDGDWEALKASGPGWLKRMAKASRKWIKDGGTVERVEGARCAEYAEVVSDIEAASWKGQEGVGRFQPGEGQSFLRRALTDLGATGEMELWLAHKDGRPAAFEINFLAPGRIWLYQGAYREEYRKYSPGGVLDFLSIERAWLGGAREYDFMSGDEPYKAERTIATRPVRYRALHPRSVRGWAAFGLLIAPRWSLKGYPAARAAHQAWIRFRNNPVTLLPTASPAGRRAEVGP